MVDLLTMVLLIQNKNLQYMEREPTIQTASLKMKPMPTLGVRTLLFHDMQTWPALIDSMFWQFAMKGVAGRRVTRA